MVIRLKRLENGVVLTLLRDAAAPAVQRSGHGGFFAFHDLLHYAVETTLGLQQAFYGLMAAGRDFETFGDRSDPRYRAMPAEALFAEQLVDVLARRLGDPARRDADLWELWVGEVNDESATVLAGTEFADRRLERDELAEIARRFDVLAQRWAETPLGGHLELLWPGV
ncbi:MAG: hypothetical protein AB7Q17_11030 [Phycisphaerae bacterium]